MEFAELIAIIVCGAWALMLVIYLLAKDIKDRKYNHVLKTKEQMLKYDKDKF